MTNAVFTSLSMFHLCTFKMHKTVIKQVDKYRKHCLWRGGDTNDKSQPKAAWEMVCLPKSEGGLGVLNLGTQNEALLLKFLDKFFNRKNIPWVQLVWEKYYKNGKLPDHIRRGSFWWRDILKLLDTYKGMAMINLGDGRTCLLWSDIWASMMPMYNFPELFSFAKHKSVSVFLAKQMVDIIDQFHLPLSAEAFQQLQLLLEALENNANSNDQDIWGYIWRSNLFSSSKAYKHLIGRRTVQSVFTCYGGPMYSLNTKCSTGYCLKIESVHGVYSREGIWSSQTTVVSYVSQTWKNLRSIFFCSVHSLSSVGKFCSFPLIFPMILFRHYKASNLS